ncbi:MAG: ABC transporter permease subunit [Chloroflexi bacterium]|nr:ABC transporter permease subunit [Chloroflexota bacterium]
MSWLTPETIQLLSRGLLLTLLLTAVTSILSLIAGILVGTMRLSARPFVCRLGSIYVDIFRNIPALVLIIFFAFAIPNLFPLQMRQGLFFDNVLAQWSENITGLSLPYYALAATVALTLNSSAYIAELFRAGVGTLPQEYVDTARSLGASRTAVFCQIILPQGFRAAFPAIETRLIHNMKNTALVAFVAVPEFFHATQTAVTRTFRAVEFLLLAAVVYLLLSITYAAFLHWVEQRLDHRLRPKTIPHHAARVEI